MNPTARDTYLETQITTATPQQLRLMLVEGAIRHGRRTLELWAENRPDEALESLIRCRGIVSELLAGIKDDGSPLARQVKGIYLFLFTALTESQMSRDSARLEAALRVLEEERATWQSVCQQMPAAPHPHYQHKPDVPFTPAFPGPPAAGTFSIEA